MNMIVVHPLLRWSTRTSRSVFSSQNIARSTRPRQLSCTSRLHLQRTPYPQIIAGLHKKTPSSLRSSSSSSHDWRRFSRKELRAAQALGFAVLVAGVAWSLDSTFHQKHPYNAPSFKPFSFIQADSSSETVNKFQGKEVVVAPGGAKLLAHDDKTGEDIELVPTGTSSVPHFPKTILLPDVTSPTPSESEYTLVGLGIRTVSFLGIQVYVMGLYVETSSLSAFQANFIKHVNPLASSLIPGEKEKLRQDLLDPQASHKLWNEVLKDTSGTIHTAFRIVPTRNTDFQHLRDGWVRGITSRTQESTQRGEKEFTDENFGVSMREFNALFSRKGKAPKGDVLILTRNGNGSFGVLYQEKGKKPELFGTLTDERIARLIWLGYLGGKNVSSEEARKRIVDGVIELVERPLGTAATKIS